MATLLAGAATDAGRAREQNEDAVRLAESVSPEVAERGFLAVVADGMGGHERGEVASGLAVDALFETYYGGEGVADAADRLKRGYRAANEQITAQNAGETPGASMGTTMVAAAIVGDQLTVANVGDSRAYLVRADAATQITHDHSLVAEQVQAGVMTPEEARESNHRNIITRALGHRPRVDVDIFEIVLLPDDRVILCCDGVHGYLEPDEFADITLKEPPEAASKTLIERAMERGSTDNVSAVVLAYEPAAALAAAGAGAGPAAARRGLSLMLIVFVLAVVIAVVIIAVLFQTGTFFR